MHPLLAIETETLWFALFPLIITASALGVSMVFLWLAARRHSTAAWIIACSMAVIGILADWMLLAHRVLALFAPLASFKPDAGIPVVLGRSLVALLVVLNIAMAFGFAKVFRQWTRAARRGRIVLAAVAMGMAACVLAYPAWKRSFPGRAVRFVLLGQAVARQIPDDLAEELRDSRKLAPLQAWSVGMLERVRTNGVGTNAPASHWSLGTQRISGSEVPPWLRDAWGSDAPEVSVRMSGTNNPECIVVVWYLYGILVGPTNYVTGLNPWYTVEAKPGIYAYHGYR